MNPVGLPALTPNAKGTCEMHFQLKEMIKLDWPLVVGL